MFNFGVSGKVRVQVVNASGEVIVDRPWKRNMVLDSGMSGINSRSWAKSFEYAVAGTGSTGSANYPVRIFTGQSVTITGGTTATSVAGTFTGKTGYLMVAMPTNSTDPALQAKITAVNGDGSQATLDVALSNISGYTLELWRVDQTALLTETGRSNTYLVSGCGWTIIANELKIFRTYDFPVEGGGGTTYTELGFSWGNTGTNLFSRVPITPLLVPTGSKLRVTYEVDLFVNGPSGFSGFAPITGWGTTPAYWGWQALGLDVVSPTTGATVPFAGSTSCNEPSGSASMFLSSVNTALGALFSSLDRTQGSGFAVVSMTAAATPSAAGGYFYSTKTGVFDAPSANSTNWSSLGVTSPDAPGVRNGFVVVFTSPQTKASTQSLTVNFVYSWARSLTGESA